MKLIQHITVGSGGAASITFSSIPGGFTDLRLVISCRFAGATVSSNGRLKFNSVGSGYSERLLYGDGSTANSASQSGSSIRWSNHSSANSSTANTFGSAEIYIPNYLSDNYKSLSSESISENNATSAFQYINAGLWSNTSAITSIELTSDGGGDFLEHSSATLYGILKGSDGITTAT